MFYKKIIFALLYLVVVLMPSGVLGTNFQDQDNDQGVEVDSLTVREKKRNKKQRKQKLQLVLGVGAIFIAGLGLRYMTRTSQPEKIDSDDLEDDPEDDSEDEDFDIDSDSDKKHTRKNQKKVRNTLANGELDPVTLRGDVSIGRQARERSEELFERLPPLALTESYIPLNDRRKSLSEEQKQVALRLDQEAQDACGAVYEIKERANEFNMNPLAQVMLDKTRTMQLLLRSRMGNASGCFEKKRITWPKAERAWSQIKDDTTLQEFLQTHTSSGRKCIKKDNRLIAYCFFVK